MACTCRCRLFFSLFCLVYPSLQDATAEEFEALPGEGDEWLNVLMLQLDAVVETDGRTSMHSRNLLHHILQDPSRSSVVTSGVMNEPDGRTVFARNRTVNAQLAVDSLGRPETHVFSQARIANTKLTLQALNGSLLDKHQVHVELPKSSLAALSRERLWQQNGEWVNAADPSKIIQSAWPYSEWRDPRTAWGAQEKLILIVAFCTSWALVCVSVWLLTDNPKVHTAPPDTISAGDSSKTEPEITEGPTSSYPSNTSVIHLFQEQARKDPSAVALIVPGRHVPSTSLGTPCAAVKVTYGALTAMVKELAGILLSLNISRGSVVALLLHRCVAQVVAVYGVLAAGAAFLPICDEVLEHRKKDLIIAGQAVAVVTTHMSDPDELSQTLHMPLIFIDPRGGLGSIRIHNAIGAKCVAQTKHVTHLPTDMAMLVYTSGTTGAPKGIIYDHRHLTHGVYFYSEHCNMSRETTALLKSPYFRAVIKWEMFPVLTRGGKLVVAHPDCHKDPAYLVRTVQQEQVTVLMMTSSVLEIVLDVHESLGRARPLGSLLHITNFGEALPTKLANRMVQDLPHVQLHNFYGASESSCTVYTVPAMGVPVETYPKNAPAGRPQPHTAVYVMNAAHHPGAALESAPIGEIGEICFGGVLAAGYYHLEALTKEKWVETPCGILYRTGDLGRWNAGNLEIVGRKDRQVKVRGVLIEPEEVEVVLRQFAYSVNQESAAASVPAASFMLQAASSSSWLREVSVVPCGEPAELVAFVSLSKNVLPDFVLTEEHLRKHCQQHLMPAYVPTFFFLLQEGLPRLRNGKVDLEVLKQMAAEHTESEAQVVLDSLGQKTQMSRCTLLENQVIYRCYTFWMLGMLLDHYGTCDMVYDFSQSALEDFHKTGTLAIAPYCATFSFSFVQPWTEMLVRAIGNYQNIFGFIILGSFQDSRCSTKRSGTARVYLEQKDLYMFLLYILMDHLPIGTSIRWYFLVVLQARLWLVLGTTLRVPALGQAAGILLLCFLPGRIFPLIETCDPRWHLPKLIYALSDNLFGRGYEVAPWCPVLDQSKCKYIFLFVATFHFGRPILSKMSPFLPTKPVYGAFAVAASMTLGLLMAMFNYPLSSMDTRIHSDKTWHAVPEFLVCTLQPLLFTYGMTHLPLDMSYWGNTTLGAYVFHFPAITRMYYLLMGTCYSVRWDCTGILAFGSILLWCFLVQSALGPVGNILLIGLQKAILLTARCIMRGFAGIKRLST